MDNKKGGIMRKFKPGDIVILNSGGPDMTVIRFDWRRGYYCRWDSKNGVRKEHFHEATIKLINQPTVGKRGGK